MYYEERCPAGTDLRQLWHDLRQQLAAAILVAEMPSEETAPEFADERLRTLRSVLHSMMDLLAVPPQQGVPDARDELDLLQLVDECVAVVRFSRGASVTTRSHGTTIGYADRVMLRRAVANVLDNASRAAGEQGRIQVQLSRQNGHACIEVTDDGRGFGTIPAGTGQGLSIVDRAMRDCHGRLEIASGPGPGTTVRLFVPAQREGADR